MRSCNRISAVGFVAIMALAISVASIPSSAHAIKPGEVVPKFTLTSSDGGPLSLENYRGKVVYLDIWASWCSTCLQSLSWMHQLQKKYQNSGFQVVTVNVDEDAASAKRALSEAQADLLTLFDPDGTVPESYQVAAMPTSYLIGPDGKVLAVHEGLKKEDRLEIEEMIQRQLGAKNQL